VFDIGFFEIILVAIIALIVVGPQRLPRLIRVVGRFVGKAKQMVANVSAEIDRELELSELNDLKSSIQEPIANNELKEAIEQTKQYVDDASDSLSKLDPNRVINTQEPGNKQQN